MTMTQSSMVTEVRDALDEAAEGKWTDVMLRKWINEAMRDLSRKSETLLTTDEISVSSTTDTYTLPTDLIRVHRVEYYESATSTVYPLEFVDLNVLDNFGWFDRQGGSSGIPSYYSTWGTVPTASILLYPKPDAVSGANIKVYYYKLATELATDGSAAATVLNIPEGWYDLIKHYVEFSALRRDRDPRWQEAKSLYDEKVNELVEMTRQLHDQVGQMYPSFSGAMVPRHLWDPDY